MVERIKPDHLYQQESAPARRYQKMMETVSRSNLPATHRHITHCHSFLEKDLPREVTARGDCHWPQACLSCECLVASDSHLRKTLPEKR